MLPPAGTQHRLVFRQWVRAYRALCRAFAALPRGAPSSWAINSRNGYPSRRIRTSDGRFLPLPIRYGSRVQSRRYAYSRECSPQLARRRSLCQLERTLELGTAQPVVSVDGW